MKNRPLGCLTLNGLIAAALMVLFAGGLGIARGGALFSPGALSQYTRHEIGGVASHSEIRTCSACHAAPWSPEHMSGRCTACHTNVKAQIDSEKGMHAALIGTGSNECLECHTEHHGPDASLTNVDQAAFPHDATGFSLKAHLELPEVPLRCEDCHASLDLLDPIVCEECHAKLDLEFTADHNLTFGKDCLSCHDGLDTYGKAFDHSAAPFPLTGKHQQAACKDCHQNETTLEAVRATSQECANCHAKDDAHAGAFGDKCQLCHTPDGWDKASFDHSNVDFPLTGKHIALNCSDCHGVHNFSEISKNCSSCHAKDDAHSGEFGSECGRCHVPDGWSQVTFDHQETGFPLSGGHSELECSRCHQNGFSNTPSTCYACHGEPAFHAGLFGSDCGSCHTISGWTPAGYNGPHAFPLNHGDAGSCSSCHPSSLSEYSCFSCHDQAEMTRKHNGEGVSNISDCARCHANGQEGDGEGEGGSGGDD